MIPALGNHLWQSTAFCALAALLAFALRKNSARMRYWIWSIASVKFLIPFSLLVSVGGHFAWPRAVPVARPEVSAVVVGIAQPFLRAEPAAVELPRHRDSLPVVLLTLWACGFLTVVLRWWGRWRRVRIAVRAGRTLPLRASIPVLALPSLLEPGVFGIFRPMLVLPEGITARLSPAHLEAIVAHEMCHVRRRDNLAAAIHMAVEAVFWFHPLVWWIGTRLAEERERACDEEVLRLGSEPEVYAESILKTCQFYLESPLTCVSGITGSDLKGRIVRIMTPCMVTELGLGGRLLLVAACVIAAAGPVVLGLSQVTTSDGPLPSFEVASVKPNHAGNGMSSVNVPRGRFTATNVTVRALIGDAYGVYGFQISGGPDWVKSEGYDVAAKEKDSDVEKIGKLGRRQGWEYSRLMIQSLLAERFKLKVRHETKDLPVYALVVAKNGPKFHETAVPADPKAPVMMMSRGELAMTGASVQKLIDSLGGIVDHIVLDRTGLTGKYDIALKWEPESGSAGASGPSIFTALQEQLGLRLESKKAPADVLVIEHVERPTEN